MKHLSKVLLLFFAAFSLVSCDKDDEINIAQLAGTWTVANDDPRIQVDGSIDYTFNSDKTCAIHIYNALSNSNAIINCTYIISVDNTLVTLFNEDGRYTEQYRILKLTSEEMKWENASPGDGNSDKRLVKVKESK